MAASKSLVVHSLSSPHDIKVESKSIPKAEPGAAVVRMLAASIQPNSGFLLSQPTPTFEFPIPSVYGNSGIGRIVSVGPDSASLTEGQLVFVESFVTARDDPSVEILQGLTDCGTEKSKKLANNAWRDGCWTTHAVVPLENATPLDENVLVGKLGYSFADLSYLNRFAVAYGGVSSIGVKAGETIIVGPATGQYGGAAVEVVSALGARVVALGRKKEVLDELQSRFSHVETVVLTGNVNTDAASIQAFGLADGFIDFSPSGAESPTHITSAVKSLRKRGRVALMGGVTGDISLPYINIMMNSLQIRGNFMYTRKELRELVKIVETGILKLGKQGGHEIAGEFGLEDWGAALELAAKNASWGMQVVFTP